MDFILDNNKFIYLLVEFEGSVGEGALAEAGWASATAWRGDAGAPRAGSAPTSPRLGYSAPG